MVKTLISAGLMVLLMVGSPLPAYGMGLLSASPQPIVAQAAAPDLTDEEISNFADAYRSIQTIKQDAEADMVDAVESEGLSIEQFNALVDNQINEEGALTGVSEEESTQFEAAIDSIIAIRQTAELEMQSAIENQGISVDRFNQIINQASQDETLKQQISEQLAP